MPEDAATEADALQIKRRNQVVQGAAHDPAKFINNGCSPRITCIGSCEKSSRIDVTEMPEAPWNGIAGNQAFHVTDIAAATQGVIVVAHEQMAGVPGIAVFATQHMAVHTQAYTNAGAPGDIGAVDQRLAVDLQRAPAPFGLQSTDTVVFNPHLGKTRRK